MASKAAAPNCEQDRETRIIGEDLGEVEFSHTNSKQDSIQIDRSGRYKKNPRTTNDAIDARRTLAESQQLSELCDPCDDLARWVSRVTRDANSTETFTHSHLAHICMSAPRCSLCRMIVTIVACIPSFQKTGYPIYFEIRESELDMDMSIASLRLREPADAHKSHHIRLAVHTDRVCNIDGISCLAPLTNEPSLRTYDLIQMWLFDCLFNHEECRKTIGDVFLDEEHEALLPKRVLNVGKTGEEYIRLIESSGRRGHYFALSHCWGSEQPLLSTVKTINNHFAGIHLQDLPRTFRDAVEITRGVGMRYLWIDSLCILQGDKKDWHEQAEYMGMLYAHACLTIAASYAEDSTKGCFFSPDIEASRVLLPFYDIGGEATGHFYLSHNKDYRKSNPYYGPLRKRAWALQEWCLSRRMLHCTKAGLTWKCKRQCLDERNVKLWTEGRDADWDEMIQTYTESKLTYDTDRLTALRGIINAYQQSRIDCNYWGIWTGDIPEILLWSISNIQGCGMQGLLPQNWNPDLDTCSPEETLVWSSEREKRYFLNRRDNFIGSQPAGVASTDNVRGVHEKEDQQSSNLFCAYMVAGKREEDDPYHPGNSGGCFLCGQAYGANTQDDDNIRTCDQCESPKVPQNKTFCWVLILEATSKGSDHFKRVGMGVVWLLPSGPTRTFHIE